MERIQSINPERIKWCCDNYGITPSELASEINIAMSSIERVMAGEDGLSFNQLKHIADFFGRGVLFFLEAEPVDDAHIHTHQFRTLANQKPELSTTIARLIERVEKQRAVYLSLREEIDNTDLFQFSPPNLLGIDIPTAAKITRKWLELAENNSFVSYRQAIEEKGILVFQSNGYKGDWQIPKQSTILGFTLYDAECPVIVIKKQNWETQQSFTLMHELGHLLLHKTSSIDDIDDLMSRRGRERDVNAFAGNLLVPDIFLAIIKDIDRPKEVSKFDEWLSQPRKLWGVSTEVILRRLLDTDRLTQSQYSAYRQWRDELPLVETAGGSRQFRYREPMHVFGNIFVSTVLEALNSRQITLAKASTYLDSLKIEDLHKLEQHYAGF